MSIRKVEVRVVFLYDDTGPGCVFDLKTIAHEIDDGEFLGQYDIVSDDLVPPSKLREEQLNLGSDGTFFNGY